MKDFEDAMLDIAWKNFENEDRRFKDIDNKSIGIITITGIFITFLSRDFISSKELIQELNCIVYLFMIIMLFFFCAILFSVLALRVRGYDGLSTKNLIERLKNEPPANQIRGIINTIAETERDLRKLSNGKAENLSYAIIALGVSITLLIVYTFALFC